MTGDLEKRVLEVVEGLADIAVLLIFGSIARGEAGSHSDLDLAVLPTCQPAAEGEDLRRHRLQERLAVDLAEMAPQGRVDVVFLDEAPDTLRQRIMEHGRMVVCRDPAAWKALRVKTMKEYGDREWARRLYRRALRRRLLEGTPSGRSARSRKPLERARGLPREA